jgi:hypothetical protein
VITVKTSADPRPITLVLANVLRRSATDPELAEIMQGLQGVLGLQSSTDPQRVTIRFVSGEVVVENGLDPAADVVITSDFNAPSGPDAPRPGIREAFALARAAARRPVFAQAAAKVLEPPLPSWRSAVEPFWQTCCRMATRPESLKVVCTDSGTDGGEIVLHRDPSAAVSGPAVEIHASAQILARCFVGDAVIGEVAQAGDLAIRGSLADLSVLTGACLAVMLDD